MVIGSRNLWWVAGTFLTIIFSAFCAAISVQFAWNIPLFDRPILTFTGLLVSANILFVTWFVLARKHLDTAHKYIPNRDDFWKTALFVFAIGLIARAALFASSPILEDDFYRYMWDGAVSAESLNPYEHAPDKFAVAPDVEQLLNQLKVDADPLPTGYEDLAKRGEEALLRTNNPNITTIYPPLAQAGFALAYMIAPFDIVGLRIVSLIAEILAFIFMAFALRTAGQKSFGLALYWWHPMVLKEFANTMHMDVLLMPFIALALLMIISRREFFAQLALGLAAAIKIWPLMLMPFIAKRDIRSIAYVATGVAILLFLMLPQLLALGEGAGLTRFGQDWQRNSFAFTLVDGGLSYITPLSGTLVRLLIAGLFLFFIVRVWWYEKLQVDGAKSLTTFHHMRANKIIDASILTITLLWLVLPTGYPWYTLWLLPFAVLRPNFAAILLTATCGFYYMDFYAQSLPETSFLQWLPAAVCAIPVWIALAFQMLRGKNGVNV
ncbi:glycosyltransferase 87 family protein [Parasphingorhabdus sp. DH2-15]|uniref:glycosyltransferase 87 family protein n=1 Tax=Parasphingorhabdus sp. DH2-15 TaxID=3444112 RepID=UPI003F687583